MTWQANWVESRDGFGAASAILEIGAGDFATSLALAERFPEKEFYGLDFTLSAAALRNLADSPANLHVLKHDARDLQLFAPGTFDFAFSVAVMEHVAELAEHLAETHRVLARNATYWFWEAPFWSCAVGHHYRHNEPNCPIPDYAHLHHSPEELLRLLQRVNIRAADTIVARIYERPDLSRLSRSRTRAVIEASAFRLATWEDQLDEKFSAEGARKVLENNIWHIDEVDLRFKGAKVKLVKNSK